MNMSVGKVNGFTKVQAVAKEGKPGDCIIPDVKLERPAKEQKTQKVMFKCVDCSKSICIHEKNLERIDDSKLKQTCEIMSNRMCGDPSDSEDGATCQMKRGEKKAEWYAHFGGVKEGNAKENLAEMDLYDERVNDIEEGICMNHGNPPVQSFIACQGNSEENAEWTSDLTGSFFAGVARKITKSENSSQKANDPRKKEVTKMLKYKAWEKGVMELSEEKEKFPEALFAKSVMLSYIKNSEEQGEANYAYKGRPVLLGDRKVNARDLGPSKGAHGDLWSPVVSLRGFRLVTWKATAENRKQRGKDAGNAYLQVCWPDVFNDGDSPVQLIELPKKVVDHMSEDEQRMHWSCKRPVYIMDKAMYGHPSAGLLFIQAMASHMIADGWVPVEGEPALLEKKDSSGTTSLCCMYEDDVAAAGEPEPEVWPHLRERFHFQGPEDVNKFLGMGVFRFETQNLRVTRIEMQEYPLHMVKGFG